MEQGWPNQLATTCFIESLPNNERCKVELRSTTGKPLETRSRDGRACPCRRHQRPEPGGPISPRRRQPRAIWGVRQILDVVGAWERYRWERSPAPSSLLPEVHGPVAPRSRQRLPIRCPGQGYDGQLPARQGAPHPPIHDLPDLYRPALSTTRDISQ